MRSSNSCQRPGAAFGNSSLFTGLVEAALGFPIRYRVPFCARSCGHQARSPLHSSLSQLPDPAPLASAERRAPGSTHCLQCVVLSQAGPPLSQGPWSLALKTTPGAVGWAEVVGEPEQPRYLGIIIYSLLWGVGNCSLYT